MSRKKNSRKSVEAEPQNREEVIPEVILSSVEEADTQLLTPGLTRLYKAIFALMVFLPIFVTATIFMPNFRKDSVFDPTMGKNLPTQEEQATSK